MRLVISNREKGREKWERERALLEFCFRVCFLLSITDATLMAVLMLEKSSSIESEICDKLQ